MTRPVVGNGRSTRNVAIIDATPLEVYRAFTSPHLLVQWLAPEGMTAEVHEFEAREGGLVRMSLHYDAPDVDAGKTTASTDTYRARFLQLVPQEKIVQAIEFESDDPSYAGEMVMTVSISGMRQGTNLTIAFDNIPPGIALEDNEAGTESSLAKLARLVDRTTC